MSNRSNLTPTVITDRNGKTTTVHKKPTAAKNAQPVLPAPSSIAPSQKRTPKKLTEFELQQQEVKERRALTGKIIGSLYNNNKVRGMEPYDSDGVRMRLLHHKDIEYLKDMQVVAELVTRDDLDPKEFQDGRNSLVFDIWENFNHVDHKADMRSMAHYSDWIRDNNVSYNAFWMLRMEICRKWEDRNSTPDGSVANLEAHYKAKTWFEESPSPSFPSYSWRNDLMPLVDKRPEHVDQLIAYVSERGIESYTDEAFDEYMDTASDALREGWL